MSNHDTTCRDPAERTKLDLRVTRQTDRACVALDDLLKAKTDADKLAAAQALESAACQLRRALKEATR